MPKKNNCPYVGILNIIFKFQKEQFKIIKNLILHFKVFNLKITNFVILQ